MQPLSDEIIPSKSSQIGVITGEDNVLQSIYWLSITILTWCLTGTAAFENISRGP